MLPRELGSTNADGRFRLSGLSPGLFNLLVSAPGYANQRIDAEKGLRSTQTRIEVGPEGAAFELRLPDGNHISGRVVDDQGFGVSDAYIELRRHRHGWSFDGTFTLRGLSSGPLNLLIAGPQGIGAVRTVEFSEGQEIRVDLPTGRLRGRVVSPTAEPVEDQLITLEAWSPTANLSALTFQTRTGPGGLFEIPSFIRVSVGVI